MVISEKSQHEFVIGNKSQWIKRRYAIVHGDNTRTRETAGILY